MEPFIGQILMFGGSFAPRGWALCHGQLLSINENQALFSILGTTYGGDGRTSFGLPDLRGRFPMHAGNGPGLSPRHLGEKSGQEQVTLTANEIPSHNHVAQATGQLRANSEDATTNEAAGGVLATGGANIYANAAPDEKLSPAALNVDVQIGHTGGSQAHDNMPPYLCVNFIIALQGLYPSRS